MSLAEFIAKYTGVQTGNTAQNLGQCVGLVSVWMDSQNIPHEWGNAKDLLASADPAYFEVIKNTPTGVPSAGDIVVWDGSWGNGAGHTGIFISGDANTFQCFEQNDPDGSTPHIKQYDYAGVIGWLHIKVQPSNIYKGYDLTNTDSMKVAIDVLVRAQSGELVDKTLLDTANATIQTLNTKVGDLTNDNTNLKTNISQVQSQNASLLEQMAASQKADSSAIDAGLAAEQENKDLHNTLNAEAEAMGLPSTASLTQRLTWIHDIQQPQEQVVKSHQTLYNLLFDYFTYKYPKKQKSLLNRIVGALRRYIPWL